MLRHLQEDVAHTGGLRRVHGHVGHIHARRPCRVGHDPPEGVVPHPARHGHMGPQAGALYGLIHPLAAGRGGEFLSDDGLSCVGRPLGRGDEIHHKAADHQDTRFFQHD